jgi:hypothetical protein
MKRLFGIGNIQMAFAFAMAATSAYAQMGKVDKKDSLSTNLEVAPIVYELPYLPGKSNMMIVHRPPTGIWNTTEYW